MNGNYIHVTNLPDDPFFDWRIHYSGPQKKPYGDRVLHLTGEEMESVAEQYRVMQAARTSEEPEGPETFWNGEPTYAYRCLVRVAESPVKTWWCTPLVGKVRKAVMVEYGPPEQHHLLDDEDGSGWHKVTAGHGGPRWPSRNLPISSEVLEVLS